jgi:hypothetical protein
MSALSVWAQAEPYRLTQTIRNPSNAVLRSSGFGSCVAMDGRLAVVGAPNAEPEVPDIAGHTSQYSYRGLVQVYDVATRELLFRLQPPEGFTNSKYGWRVAISGSLVAVSTDNELVFVYDLRAPTPLVPRWAISNPLKSLFSEFGAALALDGNRLLVGDYDNNIFPSNSGRAYCYDLSSATPTKPTIVFKNPKPSNFADRFGDALDISGHWVVIGCYYYDLRRARPHLPLGQLKTEPSIYPGSGGYACVALNGPQAAVGYNGTVYRYDLDAEDPTVPSSTIDGTHRSLAWAGDKLIVATQESAGPRVTVYAPGQYRRQLDLPPGDRWRDTGSLGTTHVAASGNWILVGGEASATLPTGGRVNKQAGYVALYDAASGASSAIGYLADSSRFKGEEFGGALALSGSLLAVGARSEDVESPSYYENDGGVYVYDLAGSNPSSPAAIIRADYPEKMFGTKVAIFGRKVVVASVYSQNIWNGPVSSVFLHDLDAPDTYTALPATGVVVNSSIKFDMAASGNWLVVAGASAGVRGLFAFDLASANPAQVRHTFVLPRDGTALFDTNAIAISGSWVAATSSLSTHVFDLSSATPSTAVRTLAAGGSAVAIAGSHLAVARGGVVKVYDLQAANSEQPSKTWTGRPLFGAAVAGSGDHFVISDHSNFAAPVAQLYSATAPVGTDLLQTFGSLSSERGALQSRVRLAMNGSSLAIGDIGRSSITAHDGSVYVHRLDSEITAAPTLHTPVSGSHVGRTMRLSFTLPEAALPGTVKLNVGSSTWTLDASHETAGGHSLVIDTLSPASSHGVASGSYPGEGSHTISLEYQDSSGHPPAMVDAGRVTIDTVPPLISGLQNRQLQSPSGRPMVMDYAEPSTYDASPLVKLMMSHPSGALVPPGITEVTATAVDLAGNAAIARFAVSVMGLTITSPVNDRSVTQSETGTLVQGTVVGSAGVVTLRYPPNGSISIDVGNGNAGLRPWSARLLNLPPGFNSLQATASDGIQTIVSSPARFLHRVLKPVTTTIIPAGAGSLTFRPALQPGGMAVVGQRYEVTAKAKRGFHFSDWAAGAIGSDSLGSFTASEAGNHISASFIPTPFTPGQVGTFTAVLTDGSQENSGYITLRLSAYTGAFTARIVIDGVSKSIAGKFDPAARYYNSLSLGISRKDIEVSLVITDSFAGPALSGEVTLNGEYLFVEVPLVGDAYIAHDKTVPVPDEWRGSYNVGIVAPAVINDDLDVPTGSGYFNVNVGKSGVATCKGRLADGLAFTSSHRVDRSGRLPLAASFAKRAGLLVGNLNLANRAESDLTGDLHWFKKPSASAYYPAGFTGGLQVHAVGAHTATCSPDTLNLSSEEVLQVAIQNSLEETVLKKTTPLLWRSAPSTKAQILFTSTGRVSGHFAHPQFGACPLAGLIVAKGDSARIFGFALTPSLGTPGSAFGGDFLLVP